MFVGFVWIRLDYLEKEMKWDIDHEHEYKRKWIELLTVTDELMEVCFPFINDAIVIFKSI